MTTTASARTASTTTLSQDELIADLQNQVRDLKGVLGQNNNKMIVALGLTPKLSNLLGLMMAVAMITPSDVQLRLGIATDTKVAMHRLRKALKRFAITVTSRRGVGYWLTDADKAKVLAILQRHDGDPAPIPPAPDMTANVPPPAAHAAARAAA